MLLYRHRGIFRKNFCSPVFCFHLCFFVFCSLSLVYSISSTFLHGKPHFLTSPPTNNTMHTQPNNIYPNKSHCTSSKTGQSVPSAPPQDITCTSPSSTSILVSWAPPPLEFQNGIITGYSIQYSTTGGNKTTKRIDGIPPESSQYLLENLEKWTEYGITVRACTEAGDGPESLQLLIRTEEDGMFPTKTPCLS